MINALVWLTFEADQVPTVNYDPKRTNLPQERKVVTAVDARADNDPRKLYIEAARALL
jgi:hypothetical protein